MNSKGMHLLDFVTVCMHVGFLQHHLAQYMYMYHEIKPQSKNHPNHSSWPLCMGAMKNKRRKSSREYSGIKC